MNIIKKKGLTIATIVYWFLLLYIVAALVWWFIALEQQNRQMTSYKLMELSPGDPEYLAKIDRITREEQRKTARNIGEGTTFLLVILVGAVFVYRAVRRHFKISEDQQNFMMAITHELKTPIAVTKLNLETLLKHKLDEPKQQQLLRMILQETDRLNTLASNILISSQLEEGGYNLSREQLNLSSLAEGCVYEFKNRFPENKWNIEIESDVFINGDGLLLQMMINNLLDNAVKYSPKKTGITLQLKKESHFIHMHVIDEGPGIPDNEKKKIFDRFYRIGDESKRTAKGTGLGLYLCKKIAADHHAEIEVTTNNTSGSDFAIHFKT